MSERVIWWLWKLHNNLIWGSRKENSLKEERATMYQILTQHLLKSQLTSLSLSSSGHNAQGFVGKKLKMNIRQATSCDFAHPNTSMYLFSCNINETQSSPKWKKNECIRVSFQSFWSLSYKKTSIYHTWEWLLWSLA